MTSSHSNFAEAKILLVCAANICRSPAAEVLMNTAWQASPMGSRIAVQFESAGAHAMTGLMRCEVSERLVGQTYETLSQELPSDLSQYDLILTMERSHRGPIVVANPSVRSKVFTLVEAAQLAAFITGPNSVLNAAAGQDLGDEVDFDFESVPQLPADTGQRWRWFAGELDAWRGQVPLDLEMNSLTVVDIPDPHDFKEDIHGQVFVQIDETIQVFITALTGVISR